MVVSVIHLLLDILAFKNDIGLWWGRSDVSGVSSSALFVSVICELITAFYLYTEGASLLILAPISVGVIVELWKVSDFAWLAFTCSAFFLLFQSIKSLGWSLSWESGPWPTWKTRASSVVQELRLRKV